MGDLKETNDHKIAAVRGGESMVEKLSLSTMETIMRELRGRGHDNNEINNGNQTIIRELNEGETIKRELKKDEQSCES